MLKMSNQNFTCSCVTQDDLFNNDTICSVFDEKRPRPKAPPVAVLLFENEFKSKTSTFFDKFLASGSGLADEEAGNT